MRNEEKQSRAHAKSFRQDMTKAEVIVWYWLRRQQLGHRFRRQHPIGPYVADFACVKERLVVEVDGFTHHTEEQRAHDARRTAFLKEKGWRLVRVNNSDVYKNFDGVWRVIQAALPPPSDAPRRPPPP